MDYSVQLEEMLQQHNKDITKKRPIIRRKKAYSM